MSGHVRALEDRLELLNVLYALCLAVILTFTFRISDDPPVSVELSFPPTAARLLPILLLLAYFILDWLSWNEILRSHLLYPFIFMGTMIGIVWLSVAVLSAYSNTEGRFLPAATFMLFASLGDLWFQGTRLHRKATVSAFVGMLLAAARVLVALVFAAQAIAVAAGAPDSTHESQTPLVVALIVLVGLKCVRIPTLRRRS